MDREDRVATPVRGSKSDGNVDKYHAVDETSDVEKEEEKTEHLIDVVSDIKASRPPKTTSMSRSMLPPRATGNNSQQGDATSQGGSSSGAGAVTHSKGNPEALRYLRRLRTNRQRVPGGAAAKLIGVSFDAAEDPRNSAENYNEEDDGIEVVAPTAELDDLRKKAKEEFQVGTVTNRRYHTPEPRRGDEDPAPKLERTMSEASLPSILNRNEIFHESAQAAVVSLLAPRFGRTGSDIGGHGSMVGESTISPRSIEPGDLPPTSPTAGGPSPKNSAFKAPPKRGDLSSVPSVRTISSAIGASNDGNTFERFDSVRSPTEQPLLTAKGEKRVEEIATQMKDPNKTLSDLLAAIASPENGDLNRGYMVRRKNACGALQVLTAKKVHRVQICWTVGVLPALTSVLEDAGSEGLEHTFPDIRTRNEYIEARKRAVASLMNLSMPQQNRLAVFHSPQLIPCIVHVINEDFEESRRGSCAVLAYLAKTPENRILMVQVPGLIDAITGVIQPQAKRKPKAKAKRNVKIVASEDDEEEDDEDDHSGVSSGSQSHSDDEQILSASTSEMSGEVPENNFSEEKETERASEEMKIDLSASESLVDAAARYDKDPSEFLHGARQNVFALLSHLVKEKDNAFHLARHQFLTDTLVEISKLHESPSHVLAVKLLAHLTRHRNNSKPIVFRLRNVVPAFVNATFSEDDEARLYACYAIQNLAQDKPCRQELAITPNLVTALCIRARQANAPEERLAAIHALKNLTDEPANLIPMSNTPECFATLMQIAHASDDSVTEEMQYLGCDALATLSHWFRSIATSGQRMEALKLNQPPSKDLFVPTLKIISWEQWQ